MRERVAHQGGWVGTYVCMCFCREKDEEKRDAGGEMEIWK